MEESSAGNLPPLGRRAGFDRCQDHRAPGAIQSADAVRATRSAGPTAGSVLGPVRATQSLPGNLETARRGWPSANYTLAAPGRQLVERQLLRATFRANRPRAAASRAAFGKRHRCAGRIHSREAWQRTSLSLTVAARTLVHRWTL